MTAAAAADVCAQIALYYTHEEESKKKRGGGGRELIGGCRIPNPKLGDVWKEVVLKYGCRRVPLCGRAVATPHASKDRAKGRKKTKNTLTDMAALYALELESKRKSITVLAM